MGMGQSLWNYHILGNNNPLTSYFRVSRVPGFWPIATSKIGFQHVSHPRGADTRFCTWAQWSGECSKGCADRTLTRHRGMQLQPEVTGHTPLFTGNTSSSCSGWKCVEIAIFQDELDEFSVHGGFLSHGGTPIAGWFISWKIPTKKWMIWGYPISGNHHVVEIWVICWNSFVSICVNDVQIEDP